MSLNKVLVHLHDLRDGIDDPNTRTELVQDLEQLLHHLKEGGKVPSISCAIDNLVAQVRTMAFQDWGRPLKTIEELRHDQ